MLYDSVAILGRIDPLNHCNISLIVDGLGLQAAIAGSGDLVTNFVMCSRKKKRGQTDRKRVGKREKKRSKRQES